MVDMRRNFLTLQTYHDIIIACNTVVLLALKLRHLQEEGTVVEWLPSYFSSRFVEYVFAFLRSSGGPRITALSGAQLLRIYDSQVINDMDTKLVRVGSRRTTQLEGSESACVYPTREHIEKLLDEGQLEAEELLKKKILRDGESLSVWGTLSKQSHPAECMTLLPSAPSAVSAGRASAAEQHRIEAAGAEYDGDDEYDIQGARSSDDGPVGDDEGEDAELNERRVGPARVDEDIAQEVDPALGAALAQLSGEQVDEDTEEFTDIAAIRLKCRELSSVYQQQVMDRQRGRFHGVQKQDEVGLTPAREDDGYISDEDFVAVVFNEGEEAYLEYGVVLGLSRKVQKGGKAATPAVVYRASIEDPSVEVHMHWFEPAGSGSDGRKAFKLSHRPREGYNWTVGMDAVQCFVDFENDKVGKYLACTPLYLLLALLLTPRLPSATG